MNRVPAMLCRIVRVLVAVMTAVQLPALQAAAQSDANSAQSMAPPARWQDKWMGMYDGQDRPGKIAPPGFKVLHPQEPDTIELVDSLSQPWARMRRAATSFELEDPGQICRPTGPLRGNHRGDFQLLVSPEKITIIAGTGGGILTAGIRRIYLNRQHLKNPPLTYLGDWIGHWEGSTLVLDGIGFNDKTWFSRDRQRHSEALHIVERWRLVSNDEWLEKTVTVDDWFALTAPFTVTRYFRKLDNATPQRERVCLDAPDARRAWLKLYRRYEREYEEERKSMSSGTNLIGRDRPD